MSYILDAMKKAEQQRNHEKVPEIDFRLSQTPRSHRGPFVKWLIFFLVLMSLIVLIFLYRGTILSKANSVMNYSISILTGFFDSSGTPSQEDAVLPAQSDLEMQVINEENSNQDQDVVVQNANTEVLAEQIREAKEVNIAVLSYSSSLSKRFIMSGADILREGDSIAGYTIIRIERNQVILDKNGIAYRAKP